MAKQGVWFHIAVSMSREGAKYYLNGAESTIDAIRAIIGDNCLCLNDWQFVEKPVEEEPKPKKRGTKRGQYGKKEKEQKDSDDQQA